MSSDGRTVGQPASQHLAMHPQAAPQDRAPHGDAEEQQNASLMAQTLNSDGTPKRPMNAFMIFARKRRPQVSAANQLLRTGEISKILSREWNAMPIHDKQYYLDLAKRLKDNFNSKYPDYVYRRRPNNSRRRRRGEHRVGGAGTGTADGYQDTHDLDDDDSHFDEPDSPQSAYPSESHAPYHTQALPHPTSILPTHQQPYYPHSSHLASSHVANGGLRQAPPLPGSSRHVPHLYPVANVSGPVSSVSTYSSSAPSPLSTHGPFSASQNHTYSPTDSNHPSSATYPTHWRDTRSASAHSDSQSYTLRTVSPSTSSYPMSGGGPAASGHGGSAGSAPSVSPTSATNSKLRLLSTPFNPLGSGGGGVSGYQTAGPGEHGGGAPSSASSQSGSGQGSAAHSPSWPRGLTHPSPPIPSGAGAGIPSGTTTPSPNVPTPFQLQPISQNPQQYEYPNQALPPLASHVPPRIYMPEQFVPSSTQYDQPYRTPLPQPYQQQQQQQQQQLGGHPQHNIPSHLSTGPYQSSPSSTGQQSAHSAAALAAYDNSPWASSSRERLARDPSAPDGNGGGAAANGGGY